jgi:hypothetical protein
MSMVAVLAFVQDYEMVVYYLAALVGLYNVYLFLAAQIRLSKTAFGLERELNAGRRTRALAALLLIIVLAAGVNNANAANLPTITPTPTPLVLFGVDVTGCNNLKARLLEPRPGQAVKGKVTLRIVADIINFAFYKIELGTPGEPDLWVTLYNNNEPAPEEEPFSWTWDSATVVPGVYHLRLTVMKADLTSPPPCVVPVQVLSTEL